MKTWLFLAGLGLFLYGMGQLETILKNNSGRTLKLYLKRNTKNLFKTILISALFTGIIQSSSVVSLITLAFVEAGVFTFRSALGVMLGANLGTTLDSWIVATIGFKIDILNYTYPIIAISSIGIFLFDKRKKVKTILSLLLAFSLFLLGLNYMKEGASFLVDDLNIKSYSNFGNFSLVIIGFIITTVIQSSSATIAIALTAIYAGAITLPMAAAIVIGSEVGTTIKILMWGSKGSVEKKRIAWGNFIYNIFTAVIAFIFLHQILYLIENIVHIDDPLIGLVLFQTSINILSLILFLPFITYFSKTLEKVISNDKTKNDSYVGNELPLISILAVDAMRKETENVFQKTMNFVNSILNSTIFTSESWIDRLKIITQRSVTSNDEYNKLKKTEGELIIYYTKINEEELDEETTNIFIQYINAIRQCIFAAKAIIDIEHNLKEFETSINDHLNIQLKEIGEEWNNFENRLINLLAFQDKSAFLLFFEKTKEYIIEQDETLKMKVISKLKTNTLTDLEASTIMNVHRELLSSKKSFLYALEIIIELKFNNNKTNH